MAAQRPARLAGSSPCAFQRDQILQQQLVRQNKMRKQINRLKVTMRSQHSGTHETPALHMVQKSSVITDATGRASEEDAGSHHHATAVHVRHPAACCHGPASPSCPSRQPQHYSHVREPPCPCVARLGPAHCAAKDRANRSMRASSEAPNRSGVGLLAAQRIS